MTPDKIPPCPGDPQIYRLITTHEKLFWRRRRGTLKPATLNAGFQKSMEATKIVAPATKRVLLALHPYLRGMKLGRLNTRIGTALRKSLKEHNELRISYLSGIEVQKEYPLHEMLAPSYKVQAGKTDVKISIPIESATITRLNNIVTDYYFEAVMLYGDLNKKDGLRMDVAESALYPVNCTVNSVCVLELSLPETGQWCLLLKASMHEGKELASHYKFYRMKFIKGSES